MENEVIVFADLNVEDELVSKLRASNLEVDVKPPIGTALRIVAQKDPKRFFGTIVDWWLEKGGRNMSVTVRMSGGETFELKESVVSEVRSKIEGLS